MAWNPTYRSRIRRAKSCGGLSGSAMPPACRARPTRARPAPSALEKRRRFLLVDVARSATAEHGRDERLELVAAQHGPDAGQLRGLGARQQASVPVLPFRIPLGDEEDLAPRGVARHQHEDRVLLEQAGQVIEVAVLPVLVVDVERVVALGGAEQHGHRVGPEALHHARAAGRQVVAELAAERDAMPAATGRRAARTCRFIEPECTPHAGSAVDPYAHLITDSVSFTPFIDG